MNRNRRTRWRIDCTDPRAMQRAILRSRFSAILLVVALAAIVACKDRNRRDESQSPLGDATIESDQLGHSQPPVVRGEPPMGVEPELSIPEGEPPTWRITAVAIDVGLAELCGIDQAQANFDYDSAKLDANARATIAALANCFVEGPLAGRDVVVIGHADPQGPDDYNRELGMSRAQAVAQALTREGLAATRIDVESHCEAHAHSDPSEWPDDRRVDIRIAG